jgi:hypothetical protein
VDEGAGDAAPDQAETGCKPLGGICLGSQADCTAGGGTHASGGDATCVFDDGPGVCCTPPAAQPAGDGCPERGGLCAPIAGCNFVDGSFAPPTEECAGAALLVCCLPESVCGEETQVCCGDTVAFRPSCDRGTFTCEEFPDTTLVDEGDCPL